MATKDQKGKDLTGDVDLNRRLSSASDALDQHLSQHAEPARDAAFLARLHAIPHQQPQANSQATIAKEKAGFFGFLTSWGARHPAFATQMASLAILACGYMAGTLDVGTNTNPEVAAASDAYVVTLDSLMDTDPTSFVDDDDTNLEGLPAQTAIEAAGEAA